MLLAMGLLERGLLEIGLLEIEDVCGMVEAAASAT